MADFRAQIPTGDALDNKLNAHCVTNYCYVFPALIQQWVSDEFSEVLFGQQDTCLVRNSCYYKLVPKVKRGSHTRNLITIL